MCRTPPTHRFRKIADDASLPASVREAARKEVLRQQQFVKSIAAAKVAQPGKIKDTGNSAIEVYSLGGYLPDIEDADGSGWGIMPLPGYLMKDSNGYVRTYGNGVSMIDEATERCYAGLKATYDFYRKHFSRNSIDGRGCTVTAAIHYGIQYENAMWWENQMFFGDCYKAPWMVRPGAEDLPEYPGMVYKYCAYYDLDTCGHELTHGVVQHTAGLNDSVEAATLNESIADCFGEMVKQYALGQNVFQSSWDISPDIYDDRTMKVMKWTKNYCRTFRREASAETGSSAHDPKVMSEWIKTTDRKTGLEDTDPHINCGIPNYAFYTAALDFGGRAWDTIGQIWYNALTDEELKKPSKQTIRGWADLTISHAERLFGRKGLAILQNAWIKAGVYEQKDFVGRAFGSLISW